MNMYINKMNINFFFAQSYYYCAFHESAKNRSYPTHIYLNYRVFSIKLLEKSSIVHVDLKVTHFKVWTSESIINV